MKIFDAPTYNYTTPLNVIFIGLVIELKSRCEIKHRLEKGSGDVLTFTTSHLFIIIIFFSMLLLLFVDDGLVSFAELLSHYS